MRRGRLGAAVVVALVVAGASLARGRDVAHAAVSPWVAPTVADTHYPIPHGALFVALTGADTAAGTQAAPLRHVAAAVARAAAGQTIVVRAGDYRESLGIIRKKVIIQPYPHETVWIKGSELVTAWQAVGTTWQLAGWNPALCHTCFPRYAIDPAHPLAGLPDQVFVDGVPQQQVASLAAVRAGAFFVDIAQQRLVLGSDPNGHLVEATALESAFTILEPADGTTIRGVGFEHFGAHLDYDVPALGTVRAKGTRLQHDTFAWSASRGLSVGAYHVTVSDSQFVDNGANGLSVNTANGFNFTRNRVQFSNFEQFSITPSATATIGAIKITSTASVVVRRNVFDDNGANAIWLDNYCHNAAITQNVVLRNAGHGIAVEVSGPALVAGNVVADNGRIGVKVSGSPSVRLWDNTIARNLGAQIAVYEEPRLHWNTSGGEIMNNVVMAPSARSQAMFVSDDVSAPPGTTALAMIVRDDRNLFLRPTGSSPVATWRIALTSVRSFFTVATLHTVTHREAGSIGVDGAPLTGTFVDAANGDYSLAAGSNARVRGVAVPRDVASAIGVPGGSQPPALGAFTIVAG